MDENGQCPLGGFIDPLDPNDPDDDVCGYNLPMMIPVNGAKVTMADISNVEIGWAIATPWYEENDTFM